MSTPSETLNPAIRGSENGFDRKALAGHLLELARYLKPEVDQPTGLFVSDLRLEQLRTLLFGREIEQLSRLNDVVENSENFQPQSDGYCQLRSRALQTMCGWGRSWSPLWKKPSIH